MFRNQRTCTLAKFSKTVKNFKAVKNCKNDQNCQNGTELITQSKQKKINKAPKRQSSWGSQMIKIVKIVLKTVRRAQTFKTQEVINWRWVSTWQTVKTNPESTINCQSGWKKWKLATVSTATKSDITVKTVRQNCQDGQSCWRVQKFQDCQNHQTSKADGNCWYGYSVKK